MLGPLQVQTIHTLAAGKLLFFAVLAAGVFGYRRLERGRAWWPVAAVVTAAILALQALIFFNGTLWNLLSGDELLVASFYQRVISDGFSHDFFYANLPPFYPPFFFYLVGSAARLLHLTGIGAAKLGAAFATALVPLLAWIFWRVRNPDDDRVASKPYFPLLLSLLPFVVVDYPSLLTKPYEFISAIGVLLWFVWTQRLVTKSDQNLGGWILVSGAIGAVLFTTYYLWFAMVCIAVLVACPWRAWQTARDYLRSWGMVAGIVAAGSAWYWLPLLSSYVQLGMENWQPAFFVASDFNFFPPVEFSLRSFWLWAGLGSLLYYRRRAAVRPAVFLLAGVYVWQIVSLAATVIGDAPFQAARGFTFLGEIILGYGAAYGVTAWLAPTAHGFLQIKEILHERISGTAREGRGVPAARFFILWLVLGVSLPFGLWLEQEATVKRIDELHQSDRAVAAFVEYFRRHPAEARLTTLSFIPKLNAQVALRQFISYNQHYSHPAANFSQRLLYLKVLGLAQTPEDFYRRFTQKNWYDPIQQLLLYSDGDDYLLYFWMDDYPNGGREEVVRWPKRLIVEPYFQKVAALSVGGFDAWRPK
ncbi:MAG: hypothetical protein PHI63_04045 [Patescibacteria group bacterium]|nr:hypothetical protein [Patescibacteria group bacterium]